MGRFCLRDAPELIDPGEILSLPIGGVGRPLRWCDDEIFGLEATKGPRRPGPR